MKRETLQGIYIAVLKINNLKAKTAKAHILKTEIQEICYQKAWDVDFVSTLLYPAIMASIIDA